jgi:hypothetical protein
MFELIGPIFEIELIASGSSIRERKRLVKFYGKGRWRKMKGVARVRLSVGKAVSAKKNEYDQDS